MTSPPSGLYQFPGPAKVTHDPIWTQNVAVLWQRWHDFFPRPQHTTAERVNAAVRFIAFASLLVFAYNRRPKYLLFGGVCVAIVTLAYDARKIVSLEDEMELRAAGCVRPTRDNPFGNYLVTDDPARAPACPYESVASEIRDFFNVGLPRNAGDVYERENSQRQFYRNPVTESIPNTKVFGDFLYGHGANCKQDSSVCTGWRP